MLLFGTGPLDRKVEVALYVGGHPTLIALARALTFLGEPWVLIPAGFVTAAVLWWRRRGGVALALLAVTLVGRGLGELQKYEIARVRPDVEPHLVLVQTQSFPSGHATSSMIFYLSFALALAAGTKWLKPAAAAAVVLALGIGTSRVMLGVHWPSDVIGGWSFGALWVLLTLRVAQRLFRA